MVNVLRINTKADSISWALGRTLSYANSIEAFPFSPVAGVFVFSAALSCLLSPYQLPRQTLISLVLRL